MLRTNLSTRPFYNERVVSVAVGVFAGIVVLLSAFNVTDLSRLTSERQRLQEVAARDLAEAAAIRQRAAGADQAAGRPALVQLAVATRQANDLIDQRAFSWTAFFGVIERTLPRDVRLVEVSPRVDQGTLRVTMAVIARDLGDLGTFIGALGAAGAFREVAARDQQSNDDGTVGASIEAVYAAAPGLRSTTAPGVVR